ncbi:MAG: restriction endonuclease [Halanaeroarchaeum sp.]
MTERRAEDVLETLRSLDPYAFEHFVADLWERQGFETTVTDRSGDRGIDVIATTERPHAEKVVIQAKRNAPGNRIGTPEIQQYNSIRRQADADVVVVVTTSGFTAGARELADELNVKRVDGERLVELLGDADAEDLLDAYRGPRSDSRSRQTTLDEQIGEESASEHAFVSRAVTLLRGAVVLAAIGALAYALFHAGLLPGV